MPNLRVTEVKAFVPARDFELSKQFYRDLGFTMASEGGGVAYFHHGHASFLLQDFFEPALASNLQMHLLVEDVQAWRDELIARDIAGRYGVKIGPLVDQPWRMRDFFLYDPSGVLWLIAQNTD